VLPALTPWSRVLLESLQVTQLVSKFLAFHGTNPKVCYGMKEAATGPHLEPETSHGTSRCIRHSKQSVLVLDCVTLRNLLLSFIRWGVVGLPPKFIQQISHLVKKFSLFKQPETSLPKNCHLDLILSHLKLVHTLAPYLFKINFNILLTSTLGSTKRLPFKVFE
jgi:hypothetical protein